MDVYLQACIISKMEGYRINMNCEELKYVFFPKAIPTYMINEKKTLLGNKLLWTIYKKVYQKTNISFYAQFYFLE